MSLRPASETLSIGLLRSREVSGNLPITHDWWAQWWAHLENAQFLSGVADGTVIRRLPPHIALLDIVMPGLDGAALAPRLKAGRPNAHHSARCRNGRHRLAAEPSTRD